MLPKPHFLLPTVSSERIVWTKDYGIAEDSELFREAAPKQVWNDSIDIGSNVRSARTEKVLTFVLEKSVKNANGELEVEIYTSLDGKHSLSLKLCQVSSKRLTSSH